MHVLWATVCYGLWNGGITGPYFFVNDDCSTITVNGDINDDNNFCVCQLAIKKQCFDAFGLYSVS